MKRKKRKKPMTRAEALAALFPLVTIIEQAVNLKATVISGGKVVYRTKRRRAK